MLWLLSYSRYVLLVGEGLLPECLKLLGLKQRLSVAKASYSPARQ